MPHKDWRTRWEKSRERMLKNQRAYRARNKERILATLKDKRANDPDFRARKRESDRRYRLANPDRAKNADLVKKYGITLEQYREMKAAQGGRCAICERVPVGEGKRGTLAVDHCHATGCVRGLLCESCNRGIGLMGESVAALTKAALYLQRAETIRESA